MKRKQMTKKQPRIEIHIAPEEIVSALRVVIDRAVAEAMPNPAERLPIPTAPGFYRVEYDASPGGYDFFELLRGGQWTNHDDSYYLNEKQLASVKSWTRLVPFDSDERRTVIREVMTWWLENTMCDREDWDLAVQHFGVDVADEGPGVDDDDQ